MLSSEVPISLEEQVMFMKQYAVFRQKRRMRDFLKYAGYFRASRYGKYLLSCVGNLGGQPKQDMLFQLYEFDVKLRGILELYCNQVEIRFKSALSNAGSIKTQNAGFYLEEKYYTPSKSENDGKTRRNNIACFNKHFFKSLRGKENKLRKDARRYPELKEYRKGGKRHNNCVPVWAAFAYFDFGTVTMLYSYLRGDIRKEVLRYAYSKEKYKKEATKQVDTWLDAVRNLRNYCAHNSMVTGMTSSVVLRDLNDSRDVLPKNTDLFSRLYALKKLLATKDAEQLKIDIQKLLKRTKFNTYELGILPQNWVELYDKTVEF